MQNFAGIALLDTRFVGNVDKYRLGSQAAAEEQQDDEEFHLRSVAKVEGITSNIGVRVPGVGQLATLRLPVSDNPRTHAQKLSLSLP